MELIAEGGGQDGHADQQTLRSAEKCQGANGAHDCVALANAGPESGTRSFPDFHLRPDISHFAQDRFNLRVTMHDDSSLFMNDSAEDVREPE